ncbi:MAG: BolA family transcriptional regulator [Gammaproteobacteria bacterium]|nr:BolA family transcriptional regulator [Gammaproteobacteria bacterium]
MRALLEARLAPLHLSIRDDSAAHAGHAGARSGGHFHVRIVAAAFSGLPLVQRHRLVQDALAPLYGTAIHALSIETATPDDLV